ncbi:MAG TPA: hypothetical protein VGY13_05160 [Solirubrobacteraceae bacterium]|nr:hypothetical protein [Solirubrobacteraceae bacterium]
MAEGSETPGGEGFGGEGRARRGEADLLAERRARRAAESGEIALTRRAEAAEATVQTLERHVSSLQQRLREVEQERVRTDELLDSERATALEREHELRRVKQREYAEQQLRIEAEERLADLDRESREQVGRLGARLEDSERETRELGQRLEQLQRQLAEAEHAAAAGGRQTADAQQGMQTRLGELERRALEIERGLDAERAARERSERELEAIRAGSRHMQLLLAEMKGIVARVSSALSGTRGPGEGAAAASPPAQSPPAHVSPAQSPAGQVSAAAPRPAPGAPPARFAQAPLARPERAFAPQARRPSPATQARGAEMADALAEAVERLRARAEAAVEDAERAEAAQEAAARQAAARGTAGVEAPGTAVEPERPGRPGAQAPASPGPDASASERAPARQPAPAPAAPPAHKHSTSLLGRIRMWRKQRRDA